MKKFLKNVTPLDTISGTKLVDLLIAPLLQLKLDFKFTGGKFELGGQILSPFNSQGSPDADSVSQAMHTVFALLSKDSQLTPTVSGPLIIKALLAYDMTLATAGFRRLQAGLQKLFIVGFDDDLGGLPKPYPTAILPSDTPMRMYIKNILSGVTGSQFLFVWSLKGFCTVDVLLTNLSPKDHATALTCGGVSVPEGVKFFTTPYKPAGVPGGFNPAFRMMSHLLYAVNLVDGADPNLLELLKFYTYALNLKKSHTSRIFTWNPKAQP